LKCPKCMEKRILDDVPVKNLCPKCGSEMVWSYTPFEEDPEHGVNLCLHCAQMKCPKCGSEMVEWNYSKRRGITPREKALCPKCGHESKVGRPHSCCGQEMLALNASKSEWKCLICGGSHG